MRRVAGLPVRVRRGWPSLLRAAAVVLGVKVAIRVAPMRLIRAAARRPAAASGDAADAAAARLLRDVASLSRVRLLKTDCLSRSLAVLFLARWSGAHVRMAIGVRRAGSSLEAHAWLESEGGPLPTTDPMHHTRLWRTS